MPRKPQDSPHVRDTKGPTPYGGYVTPSSDHYYPGDQGNNGDNDDDCLSSIFSWVIAGLIIIQTIQRFM